MLRQEDPANPRLIAYWVAAPGRTPSAENLRDFLGERLPEYAVPCGVCRTGRVATDQQRQTRSQGATRCPPLLEI